MNKNNETAIELVRRMVRGYINPDHLWGALGSRHRGIIFEESGLARCASILGLIYGIEQGGNDKLAEELAGYFVKVMDQLSAFGTQIEIEGSKCTFPSYIVKMGDDGCFGSFSLLWYAYQREATYGEKAGDREIIVGHYPQRIYKFSFNGGLIFHGHGENWSVRVGNDSNPWSIHT